MSGICMPYVHCVGYGAGQSVYPYTHCVHDVSLPVHGLHLPVCTWCVLPGVDLSVHGMRLPVFTCCGLSVYCVYYNVHGTCFLTL